MSAFAGLLESIASALSTGTGTGLDVLGRTSKVSEVAEVLFFRDLLPATTSDIRNSFEQVTGCAPTGEELLEIQAFLLSFGWLQ